MRPPNRSTWNARSAFAPLITSTVMLAGDRETRWSAHELASGCGCDRGSVGPMRDGVRLMASWACQWCYLPTQVTHCRDEECCRCKGRGSLEIDDEESSSAAVEVYCDCPKGLAMERAGT